MSNKPRIPAWQSASNNTPATTSSEQEKEQPSLVEPTEEVATPVAESPTPTKDDLEDSESTKLLDQASRFLEDPTIRDAPREKKVAFLESKGVQAEDIETLLGSASQGDDGVDLEEVGQRAWSSPSSKPAQPAQIFQPPPQPREIPPIVTYPEFLAKSEKPPPLITTQRLLNTAYISGGLMATIYGISKFIVAPMAENLIDARRDFAAHTQEQLAEFNKRLGESVSVDPATKTKKITDIADDISEADSDPTELYHRDYGTQTTPTLSRRPSVSSSDDPEPVVTAHEKRLKIIKSHLEELETTRSSNFSSVDALKTKVTDLTTYLSEMSYQNQYYSNMGGLYASNYGLPSGKDGKNDQIEVLKNDIRAVKGVFLSVRNFPAGGRSTPTMPTGRTGG